MSMCLVYVKYFACQKDSPVKPYQIKMPQTKSFSLRREKTVIRRIEETRTKVLPVIRFSQSQRGHQLAAEISLTISESFLSPLSLSLSPIPLRHPSFLLSLPSAFPYLNTPNHRNYGKLTWQATKPGDHRRELNAPYRVVGFFFHGHP